MADEAETLTADEAAGSWSANWPHLVRLAFAVIAVQLFFWLIVKPLVIGSPAPPFETIDGYGFEQAQISAPTLSAAAQAEFETIPEMPAWHCCESGYRAFRYSFDLDAIPEKGLGIAPHIRADNFAIYVNDGFIAGKGRFGLPDHTYDSMIRETYHIPPNMARIAPDLFGELRAAWGSSENRVNPLGSFTDDFDTSRSYFSGSLVGQFDVGNRTQLRPEVTLRYLDESQQTYTDSLGVVIPEQSVGQGDVSFRPRLQHLVVLESGWTLRPFIEAEGIYTFGTETNTVLQNGLRARVESGVDFLSASGVRASIGAFHDGIGADRFESTGVHGRRLGNRAGRSLSDGPVWCSAGGRSAGPGR